MQAAAANSPAIFPLMIDLDPNPAPEIGGGGLYARHDADAGRLIVTWDHMPSTFRTETVFTFQVILYQDGVFDITYNGLPLPFIFDPDATPSANPWVRGAVSGRGEPLHTNAADLLTTAQTGGSPLIENYQLAFRRYLHAFMLPLAGIVIGGSSLLMFGLPLLLNYSIVRPIKDLSDGARQMEAGEYDIVIPIQNQDEIGILTQAFNTLAVRLNELVTGLEERFRQFFEYEPDYCYIVSPEGIILDANPAALKVLGYTYEELVGKSLDAIYAPESRSTAEQLIDKWRASGELLNEEMIIISKSGERRTVLLSAGVVRDRDGNLQHSLSIQRDITERKSMEDQLAAANLSLQTEMEVREQAQAQILEKERALVAMEERTQ